MLPNPLRTGDKIAILSPASIIRPEYVSGAVETLRAEGFIPVVTPHTLGHHGSFSGTADERIADFTSAITDPEIKAIICSRGGYGCVHLLPEIDKLLKQRQTPIWLVGFSDVSALHALWGRHGIASIHASMAKNLALGSDNQANRKLMEILRGGKPVMQFPATAYNRTGKATATVTGGNLAVLGGLIGTDLDHITPGKILVIEDIAEPIYKIERMLWQLRLRGVLENLAGLVVGQFTEYKASADYQTMEQMIADMTAAYNYPRAFGAPVGHIDGNQPLLLNHTGTLSVEPNEVTLSYTD